MPGTVAAMETTKKAAARGPRDRTHHTTRRPHAVLVRLSEDEKQLIDTAAAAAQLTPTGYTAKAAVEAASAGQAPTAAGTGEDLRELQRELFAARRALNMIGSNLNQAAAAANSTGELPDSAADTVRLCAAAVARLDEVTARIHRRLQ